MAEIIPFDEKPDLGPAPIWAKHLHDCMHDVKVQVRLDREAADARLEAMARQLDRLSDTLGMESADGKGGTGLTGWVIRTRADVTALIGERNMVRGALIALGAAATLLVLGLKAWVVGIVKGAT